MSQSAQSPAPLPEAEAQGGGRRLLAATAVMASGTAISRVLGLVRAMLIAFILGNATLRANVFTLALTVPSSLYLLLAGGTLNNVLVPQIVRAVKHDEDGGKAFVDRIMTGFVLILGALTAVFTVAAPIVMSIYTKPLWRTEEMAEHWRSLLLMSYITMPQVFFYGVFFLIGQVLNAREKYGPMMWAPIANNVVSILSLGIYLWIWGTQSSSGLAFTDQQVWLLGVGSTAGIIAQTLILMPYLKRVGFTYRPRFDLRGTGLGQTFHVAKWMVGYVALTSLAQVVVTNLASGGLPTDTDLGGGVNAYGNAYLIWVLPHSLITVSLATAMLPVASAFAQSGDLGGVAAETNRALRLALTFLVPASVAFVVLADPITRVPYGNGVGAADYHLVAWALIAFGLGLVPFTIQYLYLRAFYALDNTKTPFLLQIWISGANAVLAVAFILPWDNPGSVAARLALAYSASYFLGVFLTHRALRKRLPDLDGRATWSHLLKLLVPAVLAASLAWAITWWFAGFPSALLRLVGLALAGLVAVLAFFFIAKRMGIPEAASMLDVLRRRKGDDGESDAVEAIVEETEQEDDPAAEPSASAQSSAGESAELTNDDPDGTGMFITVTAAGDDVELLDYPDPVPDAEAGQVLADRYRLAEQLAVHDGTQTWRAHDAVLDRPVLVHLLPAGDPRSATVVAAARAAAMATDSRFLRVLDVVDDALNYAQDPGRAGAYLVYEYAAGQTLEKLLRAGPMTSVETAWIVREVADALAPLHAQGHFHLHLNPATVLISADGNVKILGFQVDAALHAQPDPNDAEAVDVMAIGDLLYACLVSHWPHGGRFGLPGAPLEAGRAVPPSRVRGGVAPALDQLVDRICSPIPRGRASRLTSAQSITTELSLVLGATSAAQDLRARIDSPTGEFGDAGAAVSRIAPPVPTSASSRTSVSGPLPDDGHDPEPFVDSALSNADLFTPVPPPRGTAARAGRLPLLSITAVLVIAVGLIAAMALTTHTSDASAGAVLAISKVDDFDPKTDGGSGGENSSKVGLTIDGDLTTVWLTEKYRTAKFSSKPGVGVIVDLGSVRNVQHVVVNLVGRGTDLGIRVPSANVASGSTTTVRDWRQITTSKNSAESVDLAVGTLRTRYLLLYLTALPAIGDGRYQGGIAEITVRGA